MSLRTFSNQYIHHIKDNIYQIQFNDDDIKQIKKEIIKAKNQFVGDLTLEDLVLVRIVGEKYFPINMTYYPLDHRNCYTYIDNPFRFIIGWIGLKMDEYANIDVGCDIDTNQYRKNELVSYYYRSTKHFSINGLASNVYHIIGPDCIFDEGSFIFIEPLKNKIGNKDLRILNSVDTFFDLEDSEMAIADNAIIMIKNDTFLNLDESIIKSIGNKRIYLYDGDPQTATDLVIMEMGLLPQHSVQQSLLNEEYYFEDKKEISDIDYLNKYIDLIDQLSLKYLNMSYKNVPQEFQEYRENHFHEMLGKPGVLHSETKYRKIELEKNLAYHLSTYEKYIYYILRKTKNFSDNLAQGIVASIKKDIQSTFELPISQNFSSTYDKYEKALLDVLVELGYPKFQEYTESFNKKQLKCIDKSRIG